MDDDHDFEQGESGASKTFPKQCSALRKNEYVLLKNDHPCKIVEMSTSKTGKHGHAKVHLVGIDIFDGKKYEDICPSTHNMNVPNVSRVEYTCIEVDDDSYATLMNNEGDTREDLKIEDVDLKKKVEEMLANENDVIVTVLKAMDKEVINAAKKAAK